LQAGKVEKSFQELLENTNFRYFFQLKIEGLRPSGGIRNIMSRFGIYDQETRDYRRFKTDKIEIIRPIEL